VNAAQTTFLNVPAVRTVAASLNAVQRVDVIHMCFDPFAMKVAGQDRVHRLRFAIQSDGRPGCGFLSPFKPKKKRQDQ
jgi:hypothetical protein